MLKLGSIFAFLLLSLNISAQTITLTEQGLLGMIDEDLPQIKRIEASFLQNEIEGANVSAALTPEIYARAFQSENHARSLIDFAPVYSPIKSGEIGVRKNFSYGVAASLGASLDQRTGVSPTFAQHNATTTMGVARVQLDLWKDLLGRTTRSNLESAELVSKRAQLEREVNRKTFGLNIRRTYWALVANQLSSNLTKELLIQAEKQAKESRRRQANFIGDEGEVARYEAQAASRRSLLIALDYQKEQMSKQLKQFLPSLSGKQILIKPVDVEKTISTVLACTDTIGAEASTPYKFTQFDEMMEMLREEKTLRLKSASTTGDIDLKFTAEGRITGVDRGTNGPGKMSGSLDDIRNNNRSGHSFSLDLIIPLGDSKGRQENVQTLLAQKRFESQTSDLEVRLNSTHEELKNNIVLIKAVLKNQQESAAWLKKRLRLEQRKFSQARVSVVSLINDQDAFLNSELDVISSQLKILNLLLDYLTIFTDTPCEFNQKAHV